MTILVRLDLQLLLRLNCHKYYVIFIKRESILILSYERLVFTLFCAQDSFMKLC